MSPEVPVSVLTQQVWIAVPWKEMEADGGLSGGAGQSRRTLKGSWPGRFSGGPRVGWFEYLAS